MLWREAVFHQCEITILVVAVKFVADDGMADGLKVNADLMFAARLRGDAQQRKVFAAFFEPALDADFRLCGSAVGSDAIFDYDATRFILAQRGIYILAKFLYVSMHDGQVFLGHG